MATMTLSSEEFTGGYRAECDAAQGEPYDLPEWLARKIHACLNPNPWEPSFKWRAVSAGFKKGEQVVLQTFEVHEDE